MSAELAPLALALILGILGGWLLRGTQREAGAKVLAWALIFVACMLLVIAALGLGSAAG